MPSESTGLLGEAAEAAPTEASWCAGADVAYNWKWILTIGIFNVIGGIMCLIYPILATIVSEAIFAWTLTWIGFFNSTGVCFAERSLRGYYGFLGLLQVVVGITMIIDPFETLFAITVMIAVLVLLEGVFTIFICLSNVGMKGWGLSLTSGLASTALGVLVLSGLPESSLYTIGILLGVNLLSTGNYRIHIAMEGRQIMN